MNETEQQLNDIEISIDDARKTITRKDQLQRLIDSQDWKDIIEDGYFRDEAARLVVLKADPSMLEDKEQKQIDIAINAIGPFRQYLRTIMQFGFMAEQALNNDQQTREELLEEETTQLELV